MSKYDCRKTLDYVHERKRMCDSFFDQKSRVKLCYKCPLHGLYCSQVCKITPAHIDIVQTWSDTHPQITRADAFFELFPKVMRDEFYNDYCFGDLIGKGCPDCFDLDEGYLPEINEIIMSTTSTAPGKCEMCWDRPYENEFVEAMKTSVKNGLYEKKEEEEK